MPKSEQATVRLGNGYVTMTYKRVNDPQPTGPTTYDVGEAALEELRMKLKKGK